MCILFLFFFNDTATTEIYTLSLHDALPIFGQQPDAQAGQIRRQVGQRHRDPLEAKVARGDVLGVPAEAGELRQDRKSTRLNSSHANISYAVFCLKKKKNNILLYRS